MCVQTMHFQSNGSMVLAFNSNGSCISYEDYMMLSSNKSEM